MKHEGCPMKSYKMYTTKEKSPTKEDWYEAGYIEAEHKPALIELEAPNGTSIIYERVNYESIRDEELK